MTGWNLPPGVNVSDIPGNRPEDELALAIAEGWRPRCQSCGGFLRLEPNRTETEPIEEYISWIALDGTMTERVETYDLPIAIRDCRRCGCANRELG